ncbi:MAG: class I SAM-dependent methyltransferase [Bacteroidota bacterium]
MLLAVLTAAHQAIADVVRAGDLVIDATLGNGHDTRFLAERVGATGRVLGFDVQADALVQTRRRLEAHGLVDRVTLVHAGHETLGAQVSADQEVRAVMFNLGYLPGADKATITQPETTLAALEQACAVLAVGGRISIVVYPGHEGGAAEAAALTAFLQTLDQRSFQAVRYGFVNQKNTPPYLFLLEKLKPRYS